MIQLRVLKINEIKSACQLIKYGNCREIVLRGSQRQKQRDEKGNKNHLKQKLIRQIEQQVFSELVSTLKHNEKLEKIIIKNIPLTTCQLTLLECALPTCQLHSLGLVNV